MQFDQQEVTGQALGDQSVFLQLVTLGRQFAWLDGHGMPPPCNHMGTAKTTVE